MTTDSSLVTVATVMFGSCDALLWQPSMGRTLEILGIESHSRRPGTVCVCVHLCNVCYDNNTGRKSSDLMYYPEHTQEINRLSSMCVTRV